MSTSFQYSCDLCVMCMVPFWLKSISKWVRSAYTRYSETTPSLYFPCPFWRTPENFLRPLFCKPDGSFTDTVLKYLWQNGKRHLAAMARIFAVFDCTHIHSKLIVTRWHQGKTIETWRDLLTIWTSAQTSALVW